jgi:hypothetical protein
MFRVIWVRPGHGVGIDPEANPDAEIAFDGAAVSVIEPHLLAGK